MGVSKLHDGIDVMMKDNERNWKESEVYVLRSLCVCNPESLTGSLTV